MNSTALLGVAEYAAAVRVALDDLPDAAKRTMLDGLDDHLAEIVAEGDASLNDTLGPPETYAAELRSTAGFPAAPNPAVSKQPDAPVQWPPPAQHVGAPAPLTPRSATRGSIARVWLARSYLGLVGLLLLVLLIANAMKVDSRKIVLATLIVAALWWVARRALGESRLPETWKRRAQVGASGAALIGSALIGGQLAESSVTYISADTGAGYVTDPAGIGIALDQGPTTVQFVTVPVTLTVLQPGLIVPDLLGMPMADALAFLDRSGFGYEYRGGEDPASVVVRLEPPAGTIIDPSQGLFLEFQVEQVAHSSTTVIPTPTTPTTTVTTSTVTTSTAVTTVP
jgi:hypothetical protein